MHMHFAHCFPAVFFFFWVILFLQKALLKNNVWTFEHALPQGKIDAVNLGQMMISSFMNRPEVRYFRANFVAVCKNVLERPFPQIGKKTIFFGINISDAVWGPFYDGAMETCRKNEASILLAFPMLKFIWSRTGWILQHFLTKDTLWWLKNCFLLVNQ